MPNQIGSSSPRKSKRVLLGLVAAALVLGGLALTNALSANQRGFGDMHLKSDNLAALFELAQMKGISGETLDFYCHVFEGPFCYVVVHGALDGQINAIDAAQSHQVERALAMQITSDLDPKIIERAEDGHLKVRCNRSGSGFTCQADRGDGWNDIDVT